ncbi:hypothetical protein LC092_00965 [Stappia stellulata]|jgi:hypothetical protein|uniref:hypothetical protein n=1 Tax=Stappia TaxID=152161 RepID=UPI001CD3356D|nr:hypothetical protein [Stappia stellulata]MCA1241000.1 hypothetical protein [Stappia stellulata]
MKAFVAAIIAVAVIGTGAWAFLTHGLDYSASAVYSTNTPGAVRLSSGDGD